jgi:flagellar M-ring protein FliF
MQFFQQLLAVHKGMEAPRRKQLYGALLAALIAVIGVGMWSNSVSWKPLLTGQGYDALLTAAAALDEAQVAYRIEENGTLSVPIAKLGAAKSAVASKQVLPGLADVSELKLGLTPQAQEWAFLRAKEGDLARMVNGVAGVSSSFVNIVPFKEALFLEEQQPATASVFLKLRPGESVNPGQVRAIANLVASAVEGLEVDGVSIVDDHGNLLAEGGAAATVSAEEDPMQLFAYRQAMERRYERAVNQAVLPILGYEGGLSVTATVDMDRNSIETISRKIDTDRQAMISEQVEETTSEKSAPGGVPGVDANLPERAAPPVQAGQNSQSTSATTNFDYPSDTQTTRQPAGAVKRVSVAVQVDSKRIAALAEASEVTPEEIQAQIQSAVRAAVGFDEIRKDQVSVQFLPFAEAPWVEGEELVATAGAPAVAMAAAPWMVGVLCLLLVFWFVVRPLMAAATKEASAKKKSLDSSDLEDGKRKRKRRGEDDQDDDDDLADRLRLLVDNFEPVDATDLNRLVTRESEASAQVLRHWHRSSQG